MEYLSIFSWQYNFSSFLFILNNYLKVNTEIKQNKKLFIILGLISLAHLSAIIYGIIFLMIRIFKERKINLYQNLVNLSYLIVFQISYRIVIYFSSYEFYDWHRDVHNQFYWIIDSIKGLPGTNCQTLDTFLLCNIKITKSYIGYFAVILFITLFLFLILKLQNKKTPVSIKTSFKINIFVFLFWSLQGIYEPFRFVNYSIGYFLFLSLIIFVIEFKYNLYLLFSTLIYSLSVPYLEPYNSSLNTPQVNVLTIISVIFFFIFATNELTSLKAKNNKN